MCPCHNAAWRSLENFERSSPLEEDPPQSGCVVSPMNRDFQPAPGRGHIHMPTTDKAIPITSIQIAFKQAKGKAKINKQVSVRHLRHAYAVHPGRPGKRVWIYDLFRNT